MAHAEAQAMLLKAGAGPQGTMAWARQGFSLNQQAERQGLPRAALD